MDITSDHRIWITDSREAELALAAERARRARERAAASDERPRGAGFAAWMRQRRLRALRAATR